MNIPANPSLSPLPPAEAREEAPALSDLPAEEPDAGRRPNGEEVETSGLPADLPAEEPAKDFGSRSHEEEPESSEPSPEADGKAKEAAALVKGRNRKDPVGFFGAHPILTAEPVMVHSLGSRLVH
jgi:hypothetical protein